MEAENKRSPSSSSDDEAFHTPRGRDWSEEPEVEWMYADARVLPLPGMATLAASNPLRWSRGAPDMICQELVQSCSCAARC